MNSLSESLSTHYTHSTVHHISLAAEIERLDSSATRSNTFLEDQNSFYNKNQRDAISNSINIGISNGINNGKSDNSHRIESFSEQETLQDFANRNFKQWNVYFQNALELIRIDITQFVKDVTANASRNATIKSDLEVFNQEKKFAASKNDEFEKLKKEGSNSSNQNSTNPLPQEIQEIFVHHHISLIKLSVSELMSTFTKILNCVIEKSAQTKSSINDEWKRKVQDLENQIHWLTREKYIEQEKSKGEIARLKEENKVLRRRLKNLAKLQRDKFLESGEPSPKKKMFHSLNK